jgi:hypothetical protein
MIDDARNHEREDRWLVWDKHECIISTGCEIFYIKPSYT